MVGRGLDASDILPICTGLQQRCYKTVSIGVRRYPLCLRMQTRCNFTSAWTFGPLTHAEVESIVRPVADEGTKMT